MAPSGPGKWAVPREIQKLSKQFAKNPRSKVFIPLSEEYLKAGMVHEAAEVLEKGLKVYPTFVTALVALGRVYAKMKDPEKALSTLEEAVKISPDNVMAHRMLARLYAKAENWSAASKSCETVLFGYPKDKEMLALKAELEGHAASGAKAPPQPAARTRQGARSRRQSDGASPKPTLPASDGEAQASSAQPDLGAAPEEEGGLEQPTTPLDGEPSGKRDHRDVTAKVERLQHVLEKIQRRRVS